MRLKTLDKLTLASKQMFLHILTQMEIHGVVDLPTARKIIADSNVQHHGRWLAGDTKRRQRKIEEGEKCPHCGTLLQPVKGDGAVEILGCRKCRYSKILETGNV